MAKIITPEEYTERVGAILRTFGPVRKKDGSFDMRFKRSKEFSVWASFVGAEG